MNVTYDLGYCPDAPGYGAPVSLYLDPTSALPRLYSRHGERLPVEVTFGLHVKLGSVPASVVAQSLLQWLEAHDAELARIARGFSRKGTLGSPRGDWTSESMQAVSALGVTLSQAVRSRHVAVWWTAREYLYADSTPRLLSMMVELGSIDAFVSQSVEVAKSRNIWIAPADMRAHLQALLEERRAELETSIRRMGAPTYHVLARQYGQIADLLRPVSEHEVVAVGELRERLSKAIASVDAYDREHARRAFLTSETGGNWSLHAALAAVMDDEVLWDALCEIRKQREPR